MIYKPSVLGKGGINFNTGEESEGVVVSDQS